MNIFRRSWIQVAAVLCSIATAHAAVPYEPWFPQAPPLEKPGGQVIEVAGVKALFDAVRDAKPGGTILIADGLYLLPRTLTITTDNVTLRSASGNRYKVILDGSDSIHGELVAVTGCQGVTIADLTIQNIKWNGFKINSDRGAQRVTIHNCVIHNIWQRGVKAPHVPMEKQDELSPRDCTVRYCLFYNDRPKEYDDDYTDNKQTFDGNYIGGIDVKNTIDWRIHDNVFVGIQGRTREGRGAIYISENGRGCVIERNYFINCDIGVALGNPTLGYSPNQAVDCTVRNNFIANCPETGILACHTRDCRILNNTVHEPDSRMRRLIFIQKNNDGLLVANNLLSGPDMRVTSLSRIEYRRNVVQPDLTDVFVDASKGDLRLKRRFDGVIDAAASLAAVTHDIDGEPRDGPPDVGADEFSERPPYASRPAPFDPNTLSNNDELAVGGDGRLLNFDPNDPQVIERWTSAMRQVHQRFNGRPGYVAQIGDSITISNAFWTPLKQADPAKFPDLDDAFPGQSLEGPWAEAILGFEAKGEKHGNYPGWQVSHILRHLDGVLERDKPEVAIIMVGTNEINGGVLSDQFEPALARIVRTVMNAGCVPILNTIPPRIDRQEAVEQVNNAVRRVAASLRAPLADYYAECLRLRPDGTWADTLISEDGVHPTAGQTADFNDDNLANSGYAVRSWVNFKVYRQVYFRVLHPDWRQRLKEAPVIDDNAEPGDDDAAAKESDAADSTTAVAPR